MAYIPPDTEAVSLYTASPPMAALTAFTDAEANKKKENAIEQRQG